MELIMRFRIAVSAKAVGQCLRRICEYAAQWKDSRTERSLYNCASGELRTIRNPLFTPGCPTSWPIAVISSVSASRGRRSPAVSDFGAAGGSVAAAPSEG
jgi:hypothetical protein